MHSQPPLIWTDSSLALVLTAMAVVILILNSDYLVGSRLQGIHGVYIQRSIILTYPWCTYSPDMTISGALTQIFGIFTFLCFLTKSEELSLTLTFYSAILTIKRGVIYGSRRRESYAPVTASGVRFPFISSGWSRLCKTRLHYGEMVVVWLTESVLDDTRRMRHNTLTQCH